MVRFGIHFGSILGPGVIKMRSKIPVKFHIEKSDPQVVKRNGGVEKRTGELFQGRFRTRLDPEGVGGFGVLIRFYVDNCCFE